MPKPEKSRSGQQQNATCQSMGRTPKFHEKFKKFVVRIEHHEHKYSFGLFSRTFVLSFGFTFRCQGRWKPIVCSFQSFLQLSDNFFSQNFGNLLFAWGLSVFFPPLRDFRLHTPPPPTKKKLKFSNRHFPVSYPPLEANPVQKC